MRFLTDKISILDFGWNERALSEADLYGLCRRFGVSVQEMPMTVGGFYYRVMGRDFIAVDSKLSRHQKLVVLFHELGHFLFHAPVSGAGASFHGVGRPTRQEHEADIFAYCSLIPKPWIEQRTINELVEQEGLPIEIVEARFNIRQRFGI